MDFTQLTRRGYGALVVATTLLARTTSANSASDNEDEPTNKSDEIAPTDRTLPADKSIGFYVGSDLTDDGSTMLGGFGHEPSSHWIEIVPHQHHPVDATTTVGVTEDARIPGELTEIPQAEETNKYIASMYSEFAGFPPPLTNGGLNEHGVAARDIWSPSREELIELTEEAAPQTGPQYSDLAKAAMASASFSSSAWKYSESVGDEMELIDGGMLVRALSSRGIPHTR